MCCVHAVRDFVFGLLKQNYFLLMISWQYILSFFYSLYGISHGFDITIDLLLMAWNFKDILICIFFQKSIDNKHCL